MPIFLHLRKTKYFQGISIAFVDQLGEHVKFLYKMFLEKYLNTDC
jgi:hypothetical protein